MRGLLHAFYVITHMFSITLEVFLRHRFGERYLHSIHVILSLGLTTLYVFRDNLFALFFGQPTSASIEWTNPLFLSAVLFLSLSIWHLIAIQIRLKRNEEWHSKSSGDSWLYFDFYPIKQQTFQRFVEPALCFLAGYLLRDSSYSDLAIWIMIASVCMFIKGQIEYQRSRELLLDRLDSEFESGRRVLISQNVVALASFLPVDGMSGLKEFYKKLPIEFQHILQAIPEIKYEEINAAITDDASKETFKLNPMFKHVWWLEQMFPKLKQRQCEKHLEKYPNDALAHYHLASALWSRGKRQNAREHFEKGLIIKPLFGECYKELMFLLYLHEGRLAQYEQSERLRRAIENSKDINKLLTLAETLTKSRSYDLQEEDVKMCYQRVIAINPNHLEALKKLATTGLNAHVDSANNKINERIIKLEPRNVDARFRLAITLMDSNKERSRTLLEEILAINPNYSWAHGVLGRYYASVKAYNIAHEHYEKEITVQTAYLKSNSSYPIDTLKVLTDICVDHLNDYNGLQKYYDQLLESLHSNEVCAALHRLELDKRIELEFFLSIARQYLKKAEKARFPYSFHASYGVFLSAKVHAALREYNLAIKKYKKLERSGFALDGHWGLGEMYFCQLKNYNLAREHYEKALEINPRNAGAHYRFAELLEQHFNDFKLAGEHREKAHELNQQL